MHEYLSKTGMNLLNEISSEIALLISEVDKYGIQQYICTMGGLSKECLDEIRNNEVSQASEFIALCEVLVDLAEKPGMERVADIAKRAKRLRSRWMDKRYRQVINSQNIVDELVKVSDKDTETEFLCAYHFFLDASSLCSDQMPIFLDKLLPTLLDYKNPIRITVPQAVVNCLEELSADPQQAELTQAHSGMMQLRRIQDVGLLSIRGDEGDSTLMSTFLAAFSRFKPNYNMVLITQDAALANAVYLLNSSGVEGNDILISSLQEDGILTLWFADKSKETGKEQDKAENKTAEERKDSTATTERELLYASEDLNENGYKNSIEEENDSDEVEDEQMEDEILSEDVLEKIIDINRLLTEDEDDIKTENNNGFNNGDDTTDFPDKEYELQDKENLDDLDALEEENLVVDPQIESDYDDKDEYEEDAQNSNIIGDCIENKEENGENGLEEDVQLSSWSTLE